MYWAAVGRIVGFVVATISLTFVFGLGILKHLLVVVHVIGLVVGIVDNRLMAGLDIAGHSIGEGIAAEVGRLDIQELLVEGAAVVDKCLEGLESRGMELEMHLDVLGSYIAAES